MVEGAEGSSAASAQSLAKQMQMQTCSKVANQEPHVMGLFLLSFRRPDSGQLDSVALLQGCLSGLRPSMP